jgi:Tfp pilus assembly protein PilF
VIVPPAKNDRVKLAETLLGKAVQLDPKLGEAYVQLGILRAERGESANAMDCYQKAIAGNPNLAEAHFRLAQAYKRAGENENSESEFQIFEHLRKSEAAVVEQKRREVRQFVVVLKNPSQALEK